MELAPATVPSPPGYAGALSNLFSGVNPDYGVGVNINIPIRNRVAQADQARSQMEYRQTQMRLQQLYTQLRIQVINAQYASTNDRANVHGRADRARLSKAQSLEAEQKKYKLGASTTANVLTQERNLATGENNLISATAAYAKDRSSLNVRSCPTPSTATASRSPMPPAAPSPRCRTSRASPPPKPPPRPSRSPPPHPRRPNNPTSN